MEKQDVEKSIIKKFKKIIWSRFIRAIKDFNLIEENDKIAVCISGGKDSMLLAKLMQELKKHKKINFDLEFITMDPGYNKETLNLIKTSANKLNIPITYFKTNVFKVVEKYGNKSPCYLCSRMRRGYLYDKAKKLGCNKIALAHHFNDVIETIMLNILYNGQYKSMLPKVKSKNFEGMELIRPLYYIKEKDIIHWQKYNELNFINFTCNLIKKKPNNKRTEIKKIIEELTKIYENIDINILKSSENINLNCVLGYFKDENHYFFIDKNRK